DGGDRRGRHGQPGRPWDAAARPPGPDSSPTPGRCRTSRCCPRRSSTWRWTSRSSTADGDTRSRSSATDLTCPGMTYPATPPHGRDPNAAPRPARPVPGLAVHTRGSHTEATRGDDVNANDARPTARHPDGETSDAGNGPAARTEAVLPPTDPEREAKRRDVDDPADVEVDPRE